MSESKAPIGFARLSVADREAIASRGGKASHASGKAHRWTKEEAAIVGRKGGLRTKGKREVAA